MCQGTRSNYDQESQELADDYSAFVFDYEQIIEPLRKRMARILESYKKLNSEIEGDLENIDIDLSEFPLPAPDIDGDPDGLLYSSGRDYFEQLEAYKKNGAGSE